MKKRTLALFLAMAMTVSAFVGCSTDSGSESSKDDSKESSAATDSKDESEEETAEMAGRDYLQARDEPVVISMMYADNASYPYLKDWAVFDWLASENIVLDLTIVPDSDYTVKTEVVFNSGNIPDIVSKKIATSADVASGILLPISEYEKYMPTFTSFMDEVGMRKDMDATRFSDGNYYSFPVSTSPIKVQTQQWAVRTDIFEKNNIAIPTTMDEVYDAGLKLLELYPDSTPISNRFGSGNILKGLAAGFGTAGGGTITNGVEYDVENQEWYFAPATENYKAYLEYAKKLYDSGVLDSEFSTVDSTTYEQKAMQGDMFIFYDWITNYIKYNVRGVETDPDYNVSVIYPPEGPYGNFALTACDFWNQTYVLPASLAEDEDHLRDVLAFLDWGYSPESEVMLSYGVEGESFKVTEDGHLVSTSDSVDSSSAFGIPGNSLTIRKHIDIVLYSWLQEADIELIYKMSDDKIVPSADPQSPLTSDEAEEIQVASTTLQDYIKATAESFIFGSESLDNWDAFIAECEAKGSQHLVDMYNGVG